MTHVFVRSVILISLLLPSTYLVGQNDSLSGIRLIEKLLDQGNFATAQAELDKQLTYFKAQQNYDTLVHYIKYVGSFKLASGNQDQALTKAEELIGELRKADNLYISKEALLELAWLYDDAGQPKKAYDITRESLALASQLADKQKADLGTIEYSMGIRAADLGDIGLAKKHHLKALKMREANPDKDFESFYTTYNAIGGMMWHSAKLDSAMFYYRQALEALDKTDQNALNSRYRPALVKSNIGVLLQATGSTEEAIEITKEAISSIQSYVEVSEDESRKLRASKFKLSFIDNLGAFHHGIGEYKRADELITFSYKEKSKFLQKDDPKIMISLILLGEAKMGVKDFPKAGEYLDMALDIINKKPDTQMYWHGAALISRASVYDELGDTLNAKRYYERGEHLYRGSMEGVFTKDYLDEFIEMSLFYAATGAEDKAMSLAEEGYNYVKGSNFRNTLQDFHHTLNLAEVHYRLNQYEEAKRYSNESLALRLDRSSNNNSLLDSIQLEFRKPKAMLVKAKSHYHLTKEKSENFLVTLLTDIEKGIAALEKRRTIITSLEDLNLLILENVELFDFAKKIRLELYQATKNESYLDNLIALHESSIYNRIRSRLSIRRNIAFNDIPEKILERETLLKSNISKSLSAPDGSTDNIQNYFYATRTWEAFLDTLVIAYPRYYKMRYGGLEESLTNLHTSIPDNTSVVRYVFIDSKLFVLVIDEDSKAIVPLNYEEIKDHFDHLGEYQDLENTSRLLYELYQSLWHPISDLVTNTKVIVVPDGPLFNLSFETLTPNRISAFKELATRSLMAQHSISYNYSLWLLDDGANTVTYNDNFIAFAPEFNDKMKDDYRIAITDSLERDKTYLTLLPQPFSVALAKQYSTLFDGTSFLNEQSTEHIFKNSAKEHKIIHIGTHAESDNVSPELSRLIFAKNFSEEHLGEDNLLYTYEIYNCNLASNLAILTACETGKPGYQAGEGMISLAHAFNYAGSESLLTSLWKIDEQSSTTIVESFYQYLIDGLAKDEALRRAKLDYIANAEGRTINPQYWAGLIIMGNASPVKLESHQPVWYLLIAAAMLLILVGVFVIRKKVRKVDNGH